MERRPSCFGRYARRAPECNLCAVSIRCATSILDNVAVLLNQPVLPRVPAEDDFGSYPRRTAAACAHAAILRVALAGKPFAAEQVVQPFLAQCRAGGVRTGNARRTIREILREMRVGGRITRDGLNKWRLP